MPRVGREALELFQTGKITFPLPCAAEIMAIKTGSVRYEIVAATIDGLLAQVEDAAAASPLRDEPDSQFIDDLIATAYRAQVCRAT